MSIFTYLFKSACTMSEASILGLVGVASPNLSGFNQDLRLPMQGLRNVSNKYSSIKYYYSSSRWGPLSQGLVIPVSRALAKPLSLFTSRVFNYWSVPNSFGWRSRGAARVGIRVTLARKEKVPRDRTMSIIRQAIPSHQDWKWETWGKCCQWETETICKGCEKTFICPSLR